MQRFAQDVGLTGMAEHHVVLIFGEFDGDLWTLSRDRHVWLMSSPGNDAAAEHVWSKGPDPYSPQHGVTTFSCDGATPAELYRMLATVDGHHDEASVDDPWMAIHVRGVPLDGITKERVSEELGIECQVLLEGDGITIIRQPNSHGASGRQ